MIGRLDRGDDMLDKISTITEMVMRARQRGALDSVEMTVTLDALDALQEHFLRRAFPCIRNHKAMVSLSKDELEKIEEYILVLEKLLSERDRVIDAIPECPVHGRQCIPHALDWIQSQLQPTLQEELKCN